MKTVFPDLIIGATGAHVGVTNSVLMALFADLTIERERGAHQQSETVYLYMHDERSEVDTLRWFSHFFDNHESFVAFVKYFGDERHRSLQKLHSAVKVVQKKMRSSFASSLLTIQKRKSSFIST